MLANAKFWSFYTVKRAGSLGNVTRQVKFDWSTILNTLCSLNREKAADIMVVHWSIYNKSVLLCGSIGLHIILNSVEFWTSREKC